MHPGKLSDGRVGIVKASSQQPCYRCCKKGHAPSHCKFKHATCHSCSKVGHIAPACMRQKEGSRWRPSGHIGVKPKRDTKWLQINEIDDSELLLCNVSSQSSPPVLIDLQLNGKNVVMELDTGAAMSLISQSTYDKFFSNVKLHPSDIILRTYTSQAIIVLGQFDVDVIYEDQKRKLSLLVIKGSGPSLIGRNWMSHLRFNWSSIKHTRTSNNNQII